MFSLHVCFCIWCEIYLRDPIDLERFYKLFRQLNFLCIQYGFISCFAILISCVFNMGCRRHTGKKVVCMVRARYIANFLSCQCIENVNTMTLKCQHNILKCQQNYELTYYSHRVDIFNTLRWWVSRVSNLRKLAINHIPIYWSDIPQTLVNIWYFPLTKSGTKSSALRVVRISQLDPTFLDKLKPTR